MPRRGLVGQGFRAACTLLAMSDDRVRMARVLRPGQADDGSFDLAFWQRIGAEGIFSAAWEMVAEVRHMRGQSGDEPRLQRSVLRIVRPER